MRNKLAYIAALLLALTIPVTGSNDRHSKLMDDVYDMLARTNVPETDVTEEINKRLGISTKGELLDLLDTKTFDENIQALKATDDGVVTFTIDLGTGSDVASRMHIKKLVMSIDVEDNNFRIQNAIIVNDTW